MSDTLSPCPVCACEYTYAMGELLVCPECAHEWSPLKLPLKQPVPRSRSLS